MYGVDNVEIIERLTDKHDQAAYSFLRDLLVLSAASNELYLLFDDFLNLIVAESSFVRTRGFVLCCAQARWDTEGKLAKAWPKLASLLRDEKPTVVRQSLAALHEVALYRPELCALISEELEHIDLTQYNDSMAPLIKKDIDVLKDLVG